MIVVSYYFEKGVKRFRKTKLYKVFRFFYLQPLIHIFLFLHSYQVWLSDKQRHQYFVAGSWNGKSEYMKLLIWAELRKRKNEQSAVVLLDPHWDLAEEIAMFKEFSWKKYSSRLVYIDPTLKEWFFPWINPFDLKSRSERIVSVMSQELKRVFEMLLSDAEPTPTMSTLLHACIATLLRRKWSKLEDLQRFMTDTRNADLVMLGKASPNRQHAQFFTHEFMSADYRLTKRWIYTRLQSLLHDPIFENLISQRSSFDLEKLINERKIIVFRIPLWEWGSESMQAYWRFIFWMLRIIALGRSREKLRVPTFVYVDEFQNFVSSDLERALTQFRKFWMYLILTNQFPWQDGISTSLQRALFSSGVLVVGRNEFGTLKRIERQTEIPATNLKYLRPWRFYVQTSRVNARKIKVPTYLLGSLHSMKTDHWERLKREQIQKYYFHDDVSQTSPHPLQPKYSQTWSLWVNDKSKF